MAERRIALVAPRYGTEVVGGAETVIREAAHALSARGWTAEVLTTCALDHYSWANHYPPGAVADGPVLVRRFPVHHDTDRGARHLIEARIQQSMPVDLEEQRAWLTSTLRVPDLFHHLLSEGDSYRAVVFAPYMFWTTAVGALAVRDRAVVMPCLHDEPYARLEIYRPVLEDVRQLWFLSEPEHELAHGLASLADHRVTGAGVTIQPAGDAEAFRRRHGLERPFAYFTGRREGGKGWDLLLETFTRAVVDHGLELDLVTSGVGSVVPDRAVAGRVRDLGFLGADELPSAFAAAAAYVQPSPNESFSITTMQAWMAGTPVLAYNGSRVVAWHVERSGAGLLFSDDEELVQCLLLVADDPQRVRALAAGGRSYVIDNYSWDVVGDAMVEAVEEL